MNAHKMFTSYLTLLCCCIAMAVVACGIVVTRYNMFNNTKAADPPPCESIDEILKQLASSDMDTLHRAVILLGCHGPEARKYLPELHKVYDINQNERGDEFLAKEILLCLHKITQTHSEVSQIIESWGNEWVLAHPAEAAKRGYKLTP